jgi:hypothetical protein
MTGAAQMTSFDIADKIWIKHRNMFLPYLHFSAIGILGITAHIDADSTPKIIFLPKHISNVRSLYAQKKQPYKLSALITFVCFSPIKIRWPEIPPLFSTKKYRK